MRLGTPQAENSIKNLIKDGFTKEHAIVITKCDIYHIKLMLTVLFKDGKIFPNYYTNKRGYTTHYNKLEQYLRSEHIKFFEGNDAPRLAVNGMFIQLTPIDPNRIILFNLTQGEDWFIIESNKKLIRGCSNAKTEQVEEIKKQGHTFVFRTLNKKGECIFSGLSKKKTLAPLFLTDSNPNKAMRNTIEFFNTSTNKFEIYI